MYPNTTQEIIDSIYNKVVFSRKLNGINAVPFGPYLNSYYGNWSAIERFTKKTHENYSNKNKRLYILAPAE